MEKEPDISNSKKVRIPKKSQFAMAQGFSVGFAVRG